ncbi:YfiH family protein [Natrialba magadii ATCC 43099]|uniref:Xylose isomerase n=1 Tax=Natrialba magadii (strain ATCC 43099 / DSM 3394 / CCM 3739 / CIP 104546 / IAM 13178 / JCM 8861 / NBRC 102185 / NCIMB 2190 / MS3) TaxID=547559 RepID=D3T007_NATMM|nr:sugar phosphate isomerase/epimerase family protein [Natrialba magadii]ADD04365.1 YfiH family protein [Natrialba magadii ATCC 43099]ELY26005.1 xylose isomerase [Natrialba magadii ATCC 43099]
MVDLAFSTNAYTRHSLPEAVRRIADHGYAGVELLGDEPHAYFPEFDNVARDDLIKALEETGLSVSNINANTATGYYDDAPPSSFFEPSIIQADDDARAWRVEYTKRAIDLAETVDAPAVCLATGRPLPGTPPEEAREYLHESLGEILDYAEPRDVDVGIEFEPELLIENTDEVLALTDEIGRDSLGVNLDVGHAAVYGEDVVKSIRRSAGSITGVHLEDIVGGRRGKHYHRIPGEGDLDFRAIFDALDDIGYDGFATLELYTYPDEPDRAAREAYDELSQYV